MIKKKDSRTRNVHASTAIEGNPQTLEHVRALEEGRELAASDVRSSREVLNYFAGLRILFLADRNILANHHPSGSPQDSEARFKARCRPHSGHPQSEMNVIHVLSQWPGYRFRSDEPKFFIGLAIGS